MRRDLEVAKEDMGGDPGVEGLHNSRRVTSDMCIGADMKAT